MLRRRLCAYALMFCIGIVTGFIYLEKDNLLAALILSVYCVFLLYKLPLDGTTDNIDIIRQRMVLVLIAGIVLMARSYIYFDNIDLESENDHVEGIVSEIKVGTDNSKLVIRALNHSGDRVLVTIEDKESIGIGDRLAFNGRFIRPARQVNPHCFDYGLYLRSRNIRYSFKATSYQTMHEPEGLLWKYRRYLYDRRIEFERLIIDDDTRALVRGIIMGDKGEIDEDTLREFNENATGHILAVSGLHIGFIFALLRRITRRRRTPVFSGLIVLVLAMYGEMTMWSPSTIRSVSVMGLGLLSTIVRRPFDLLSAISGTAMAILVFNPYQLFNTGFQMSYIAMLGIVFIGPLMGTLVGDDLGTMLSVQLSTALYTLLVFHRLNLMSLFINIPIVIAASVLVPVSIAGLAVLSLSSYCPGILIALITGLAELIREMNSLLNFGGEFSNLVASPGVGAVIAIYAALFIISSEWARISALRGKYLNIARVMIAVLISCFVIGLACSRLGSPELTFISVGQGDAVHIRSSRLNVLIDGGGSDGYSVGEKVLQPYLLSNGVTVLDAAVVTHLHMDHYQGIKELMRCYPVRELIVPSMYRGSDEIETDPRYISKGEEIILAKSIFISPIWPVDSRSFHNDDHSEYNELNMVYMVNYRGVRIMITGDILDSEELKMIKYYKGTKVLDCDILKVAHHGSRTSTTDEFLNATTPEIAVISVGSSNVYGHPNVECLERLSKHGIKIFRTDINGAVGIDIGRSGKYSVRTML